MPRWILLALVPAQLGVVTGCTLVHDCPGGQQLYDGRWYDVREVSELAPTCEVGDSLLDDGAFYRVRAELGWTCVKGADDPPLLLDLGVFMAEQAGEGSKLHGTVRVGQSERTRATAADFAAWAGQPPPAPVMATLGGSLQRQGLARRLTLAMPEPALLDAHGDVVVRVAKVVDEPEGCREVRVTGDANNVSLGASATPQRCSYEATVWLEASRALPGIGPVLRSCDG